ncbi:hypothetical protein [Luteibacter sp.]|uniref:hypothetical protein n=1 Tax=Luteibacter sp. TaxID=1886636 RepID=UPI003F8096AA
MRARGTTLIELAMGLAIAAVVSAAVLTGAAAVARGVRHHLASAQAASRPADALEAMLADVQADPRWSVCQASRCSRYVGESHGVVVVTRERAWAIGSGGLRVCSGEHCERVLASATALQVIADTAEGDRITRGEIIRRPEGAVRRLELRLWLADGRPRSRSLWMAP